MTPDRYTLSEHFVDVGESHVVYVQEWGNAKSSVPVVYLHGGPGNGCGDNDKKRFSPDTDRVIFIDQRGSGRSTPFGETRHNTTHDLVGDIEKILKKLKITKAVLVGGSWGSSLALCFGISHPQRVAGMVLDGILTASQPEIDWIELGGWKAFFPEVWQELVASVPASYSSDPTSYHYSQIKRGRYEETKRSVYELIKAEAALLKLDDNYSPGDFDSFDPAKGLIETTYAMNRFYITRDHIYKNAGRLTMPIYLIQGRYDMVCMPAAAYELSRHLPDCQLIWTINGHVKQHEASTVQRLIISNLTKAS